MKFAMKDRLRVVIVAAEVAPFAAEGKIAGLVRALPETLACSDCDVSLVLPKYRRPAIEALSLDPVFPRLLVPLGPDKIKTSVFKTEIEFRPAGLGDPNEGREAAGRRLPVYFIDNAKYFGRDRIYGSEKADYLDNDERFTFFSRAVLEFLCKARIGADIIHCHDWPTALVPLFLRTQYAAKRHFRNTASVFTLHDPKTQGIFPPESFALTGLNWDFFTPEQLALNGRFNYVKAGLIFADALNAASVDCAEAVRSGAAGAALAEILARRGTKMPNSPFPVIEAAGKYLELYRQAIEFKRGESHVR